MNPAESIAGTHLRINCTLDSVKKPERTGIRGDRLCDDRTPFSYTCKLIRSLIVYSFVTELHISVFRN